MKLQFVIFVLPLMLSTTHNAIQSVQMTMNVDLIKLVLVKNVLILVLALAATTHFVKFTIMNQFVNATKDFTAILLFNVIFQQKMKTP